MKKFLSLFLTLVLVLLTCSCTGSKNNTVKIGIAAPDVTHGWVAGVAYYAEKYCKDNNVNYKIITSSDAAEMSASINDLIAWGADVLVTYPQWTGMESAISEVVENGTPVVSFDIDINVNGIYKVSGDNYGMGQKSAEYFTTRVQSGAVIAVLDVPSCGSVASLRKQGFYDYLDSVGFNKANIFEVSCTVMTREEGLKQMSDILSTHSQIDAVFSIDDELSIGCVQAITESGRTDIKCISGGGGMQEYFKMIDNPQYADLGLSSALYSPMMIQNAIQSAISIAEGETVDKKMVIQTAVVTKENVKDYLDAENTVY